jgi:hypothetical protein
MMLTDSGCCFSAETARGGKNRQGPVYRQAACGFYIDLTCTVYAGKSPLAGKSPTLRQNMMCRVGQNRIYTVYIQYFWQGTHQTYAHIQCIHTVLANPDDM